MNYQSESSNLCSDTEVTLDDLSPIGEDELASDPTSVGRLFLRIIGVSCTPPLTRRPSTNSQLLSAFDDDDITPQKVEVVADKGNGSIEKVNPVVFDIGTVFISRSTVTEKDVKEIPTEVRRRHPFSVFEEDSFDLEQLVSSGVCESG